MERWEEIRQKYEYKLVKLNALWNSEARADEEK